MGTKTIKAGSRHPKVVMIFENEDDILGAANLLLEQIDDYRSIPMNNKTTSVLTMAKPAVILFALSDITKCIEYYSLLVEKAKLTHQGKIMNFSF